MKLASIETISEIQPHPNADRLELAKVLGWQAVVNKGQFKPGDNAVFVVIDTILPRAPWSEFLVDQKRPDKPIRLNTVKLRGQHSQGLVLPIDVLPEASRHWHVGADVGGELGVKKYEKEIPAQLSGIAKGNFPLHLAPRTDEDNGLSNMGLVAEVLRNPVCVTLKLDGSSCTIICRDGKIEEVCSRNLSIVEDDKNAFWKAAKKLQPLVTWLGEIYKTPSIIQGELMGPGVQGNQLELSEPEVFIFQIRAEYLWVSGDGLGFRNEELGYKVCPVLRTPPNMGRTDERKTLAELQALADAATLPNGQPAEGIVVRAVPTISAGNGRPLGFKIINRNYKEQ